MEYQWISWKKRQAWVARENLKMVGSPKYEPTYVDNLEFILELEMSKKKEILDTP